jgi:outer membrane receptor for ferrienterochelin and colicin
MGNPDLKPQKTVMYEIGLQQQLTDNIGIDLTLFYRDVRDWIGTTPLIDTYRAQVRYSQYENKDYSNVRGVTLKVEKRFANNYSIRADYSFQKAEGTYSDPQDAYNDATSNRAPVLALLPMNWDQTHTLNAQLIYDFRSWTFSLIGRYWSGRPYTPSFAVAETVGGAATSGLRTNSERRPSQRNLDLTLNKAFSVSSDFNLEFFVNVYNVLDLRDETSVYGDTGTADYTTTTRPTVIQYNAARISSIEDFVLQPSWYTAPRQIHVGLILGF